jgi:hypothetical protein
MYVVVHLEFRYVGAFVTLFWCGVLAAFQHTSLKLKRSAVLPATAVVVALTLLPIAEQPYKRYFSFGPDPAAQAATELRSLGISAGDRVARISPLLTDLSIERIARVEVTAEVDFSHAKDFWAASPEIQQQILVRFASVGAKAVIASRPQLTDANRPEWKRMASSEYWVWLPNSPEGRQKGGPDRPMNHELFAAQR